ncbi:ABC transporter permease [bacterium]|nr:ABC transporter permease [bacterium]
MNVFQITRTVKVGLKSLMLHKMRSVLTALGVIFGVCSVIAMLSIGEGAGWEAQQQIKLLGSNNIIIRSQKPPEEEVANIERSRLLIYGLTYKDAERIATTVPAVKVVVPMKKMDKDVYFGSRRVSTRLVGTVPWYPDIANFHAARGRFITLTDMSRKKNVCVLGEGIAKKLFTYLDPLQKEVKIGPDYYTVVGIMEQRDVVKKEGQENLNLDIYMPLSTARERYSDLNIKLTAGTMEAEKVELKQITVRVNDVENVSITAKIIRHMLKRFHKKVDYEIIVPLELLHQAEKTKRIFNIVLGSIAAISLLVGGIGIMNIMLASVTERTREIGIRRALGAKRRDIILQFLVETIVLSAGGGVVGLIIGVVTPRLVTYFADMRTIVTPWSLILAFGISAAIGVIFGLYPASRAANMDPIEALRHE